jgi:hypothetical protein
MTIQDFNPLRRLCRGLMWVTAPLTALFLLLISGFIHRTRLSPEHWSSLRPGDLFFRDSFLLEFLISSFFVAMASWVAGHRYPVLMNRRVSLADVTLTLLSPSSLPEAIESDFRRMMGAAIGFYGLIWIGSIALIVVVSQPLTNPWEHAWGWGLVVVMALFRIWLLLEVSHWALMGGLNDQLGRGDTLMASCRRAIKEASKKIIGAYLLFGLLMMNFMMMVLPIRLPWIDGFGLFLILATFPGAGYLHLLRERLALEKEVMARANQWWDLGTRKL